MKGFTDIVRLRGILPLVFCMLLLLILTALVLPGEGPPVTVTGLSFDQSEMTLTAGSRPGLLTAAVTPSNATGQAIVWSSSDETIATVKDGVVTPLAEGEADITAEISDGDYKVTCPVTVHAAPTGSGTGLMGMEDPQLTLHVDGGDYGYVTAADGNGPYNTTVVLDYDFLDEVTLTASTREDGRFYGWVDGSGKFLTTDSTYPFVIDSDTELWAIFAEEDSYAARRNGEFYTENDGGLAQALGEAEEGDTIVMLEDQTLSGNATVPSGVKLYIPFQEGFVPSGRADGKTDSGSPYHASPRIATAAETYRTLVIDSGVTFTVNGTLNIGGVISYPGTSYNGHTSGWHGKVENSGDIVIENGGILDCWGFITGNGTVTTQGGSKVYEPFIVYDFAGGNNTQNLYLDNDQSPFKQYAMQNVQNTMVLNYGSKLYGRCNLYALSSYNKTDIVFLGDKGMYQPANDAVVTRTYDAGKFINTNGDIGKITYNFEGGMTLASLAMPIMVVPISTKNVDFPIPYNWDLVFANGDYKIEDKVKVMPGATMTLEDDASLSVEGTLFVLDGLIQSDMSGKSYPSTQILKDGGFSASGQLFVNGHMTVKRDGILGGTIQTQRSSENAAVITVESGAIVNSTGVQDGGVGYYDVNTTLFDLPARAYVYDASTEDYALEDLFPGRIYSSHDSSATYDAGSYPMVYAVDCTQLEWLAEDESQRIPVVSNAYHKWANGTVHVNEPRTGSWVITDYIYHDVNVESKTVYDPSDGSRTDVELDSVIRAGDDLIFKVDTTELGQGYVYQVSYVSGAGDPVVLTVDNDGNYTISQVGDDVTITVTSCMLGDLSLDGNIDNADLMQLRKILSKTTTPTSLQALAGDTHANGDLDNADLMKLRKYLAGTIGSF